MNILEQLIRVLTNAYSRSQRMFGERVSPGPANQRNFHCLPCCWGQLLIKRHPWTIWLIMLCLSPYQRVFYALASWCPSQRTRDSSKTPRPISLCPKVSNTNGKLLSPNHLRSLPTAPHFDLSARQYKGVIPGYDVRTSAWQHVFRGCFRSYSATASLRHREGKLCGSCGRKTHSESV